MGVIYEKLHEHFAQMDLITDSDEEKGVIRIPIPTKEGIATVHAIALEESSEFLLHTVLGFQVPGHRAQQVSRTICRLNWPLKHGSFDFDEETGLVRFRHGSYCLEGLSDAEIALILISSLKTVEYAQGEIYAAIHGVRSSMEEDMPKVAILH